MCCPGNEGGAAVHARNWLSQASKAGWPDGRTHDEEAVGLVLQQVETL